MLKRVNIPKEYENRFLKKDFFEFNENTRFIMLYGCNGVGKSSLLNLIANQRRTSYFTDKLFYDSEISEEDYYTKNVVHTFKNKIPKIYFWKASFDAPLRNAQECGLDNPINFSLLWDSKHISEGQSIERTFLAHLNILPNDIDLLLIDELDSGLSAGHIHVCMQVLFEWLRKHKHTQCIISINNYHWVYVQKNVYRMDIGEFQNIEDYEKFWEITKDISIQVAKKEEKREDY